MPGQNVIDKKVVKIPLDIQGHTEEITLDYLGVANHEVILGRPWLRKHNPQMDWQTEKLSFDRCQCARNVLPSHPARMEDEEASAIKRFRKRDAPRKIGGRRYAALTTRKTATSGKKDSTPSEVPTVYNDWRHLFKEATGRDALPAHKPYDHEIKIMPGKEPTMERLYGLSEKELAEVRDYIKKNVEKGYIRESKSSAGYPILFVPKKDGTLRMCVDYRKLNDITIKDRYPLPNISELQDRLRGAKFFTALNLREGYYNIHIKEGDE